MADRMTKEQRHLCMSHIRGKDTRPEIAVRKGLFAAGFRFRLNVRSLPGTPDIVLRKYHTVVFVNGCFWHGHEGCRYYVLPKTNSSFWAAKIDRNRRRDSAVQVRLQALGWKVIVLWECELNTAQKLRATLEALVGRLRANREEYLAEVQERKLALEQRQQESSQAKARSESIDREVAGRYSIPRRIRTLALADPSSDPCSDSCSDTCSDSCSDLCPDSCSDSCPDPCSDPCPDSDLDCGTADLD